jgi:histidyl-tRNA synthetase
LVLQADVSAGATTKRRTRQFHQAGAEFSARRVLCRCGLLAICQRLWTELGISGLRLEINSLGAAPGALSRALHAYFAARNNWMKTVCRQAQSLAYLDSKTPSMQDLVRELLVALQVRGPMRISTRFVAT